MPYQAKKILEWGPHLTAVTLMPGDEVPLPFNKNRIPHWIVAVDEVSGKKWADQPKEAQDAWAELNSLPSAVHPTQLVTASVEPIAGPAPVEAQRVAVEEVAAPSPKRRGRPKGSMNRGRKPRE